MYIIYKTWIEFLDFLGLTISLIVTKIGSLIVHPSICLKKPLSKVQVTSVSNFSVIIQKLVSYKLVLIYLCFIFDQL